MEMKYIFIYIIKTYIRSMLLYGSGAWAITPAEQKRLEAMEMWCYRRMMTVKWTERFTKGRKSS
jgi:hypothetical protein